MRKQVIKMRKHIVHELEVPTSADALWAIYSSPQFPKLIVELLPTVFQKIELVEGDRSPGTVFKVTLVPGGYLELGCSYYMNSLRIMEKDCDSCIIKYTVTYELTKDANPNVDDLVNNITVVASVAEALSKYVLDKKGSLISFDLSFRKCIGLLCKKNKKMVVQGKVSNTVEVGVPANEVWEIYGTLKLGKLVDELLPHVVGKVELVEGDGGVGTVFKVTFPPGTPGASYLKEKFAKIDNENRVKETEVIEGGLLDFGFTLYRVILEIADKFDDTNSSIIKSTIEYEIEDDSAANASFVSLKPFEDIAEAVQKYLLEKARN